MAWHNARPRQRNERAPAEFIDPCLPTKVDKPPAGDDWAHEIKFDGYRIQIHVGGGDVKIFTMSGYDWTNRYPLIAAAAAKLKSSMIIDAEAVIQRPDGVTDFEALHDQKRFAEAFAFVFDLMMLNGSDLRALPWRERRADLQRIFRRSRSGLVLSKAIVGRGPDVYQAACHMGLEGIVSKRIDAAYCSGKSSSWLKIKNPNAPGVTRFKEDGDGRRIVV